MKAKSEIYIGLFLISLATLMYEVLLTRIFSVTMWYHFAFVAVSLAMFGMTLGALAVYLRPRWFIPERVSRQMGWGAILFALTLVATFLLHLRIRFTPEPTLEAFSSLAAVYVLISIPFVFSGVCITLALTRFPDQTGSLYAADLAGAALGCVLLIAILDVLDAPAAALCCATLGALSAVLFFLAGKRAALALLACAATVGLGAVVCLGAVRAHRQTSLFRLKWVKGRAEAPALYEKWNSFSRVTVTGNPKAETALPTLGISPAYHGKKMHRKLDIVIDACAATLVLAFDGNFQEVAFLRHDVLNVVHHLRRKARVLIVGTGGGRDVLSALAFGQPDVTGVEINGAIINAVNERFGDFTGHLDGYEGVRFVHDEARSYIARQHQPFDVIQVSFIDTWAATAAGAFVLSENSLYTTEAWTMFLDHLTPTGVLSVSRWHVEGNPSEMYRLMSLACGALWRSGVTRPSDHIVVVRLGRVGTMLVSPSPFSPSDLDALEALTTAMQFELTYSPRSAADPQFGVIAAQDDLEAYAAAQPLDLAPPTDDKPFFFNMLRFRDVFKGALWRGDQNTNWNLKAIFVLASFLVIVLALTLGCILLPLLFSGVRALAGAGAFVLFFASIGLGFMLVEISQMQRLIVFLGHPVYGLSVVLFTLLAAGGAGSWLTQRVATPQLGASGLRRLLALLLVLTFFGALTPMLSAHFEGAVTPVRILLAVIILSSIGLFMGMAFPLGMRLASAHSTALTPWLWGINGATSVCASVLAVAISMSWGISVTFWTGLACYAVATAGFLWATQRPPRAA